MSFDIALSGIQAINQQLESVSNNIANASTYGYKSTRANFSSVYAGSQANGVEIGSTTQNISQNGSMQTTGRGLDAAIDGRGFFASRNPQGGMTFSRVGIFSTDTKGFLVDSNGSFVQGYGKAVGGAVGPMGDVQVPTGQIPAVATTKVDFVGNMSADWTVHTATNAVPANPAATPPTPAVPGFAPADPTSYNMVKQSIAFDSLGVQHTVSQYFIKTGPDTVDIKYYVDGATTAAGTTQLKFDAKGQLDPTTAKTNVPLVTTNGSVTGGNINFDYTGTTRFAGEATSTTNRSDGYASGSFVSVELAQDGSLVAKYSNDQSQVVGTLAIANFANEGELAPVSGTSWTANAVSGAPLYNMPGTGLAGKLNTGALEGSNVDITSQLVGLMTSQRNYQANSKVLTTENQMMQSLMQAL
jgi:flagellar hook protein FlgE